MDDMAEKNQRNARVQTRYGELMAEGRHGHYETMFRIVREEVERERAKWVQGAKVTIPTEAMEQEFQQHYVRGVRAERERCAAIARQEADIREAAGKTHPEDSAERGRCFAGARAAKSIEEVILRSRA